MMFNRNIMLLLSIFVVFVNCKLFLVKPKDGQPKIIGSLGRKNAITGNDNVKDYSKFKRVSGIRDNLDYWGSDSYENFYENSNDLEHCDPSQHNCENTGPPKRETPGIPTTQRPTTHRPLKPRNVLSGYANNWDGQLNFECPLGEYVTRLYSYHNNWKEDRLWKYGCTYTPGIQFKPCYWSRDLNSWDHEINYSACEHNGVGFISGFKSHHSNWHEDRIWKVKCCPLQDRCVDKCEWTGYINGWDDRMDHSTPNGYGIMGVQSDHHNFYEDRRWKIQMCKTRPCRK